MNTEETVRTTNQKLVLFGLTSEKRPNYRKAIFRRGVQVFEGNCFEVEAWITAGMPAAKVEKAAGAGNEEHEA